MSFTDIHQRVAADISFLDFIGQLCYALECGINDPDSDTSMYEYFPWELTSEEYRCIWDNSNILYRLFDGY